MAALIGYRPASGEATDTILARVTSAPRSQMLLTAKSALAQQALAPLTIAIDGKPLVPTSVRVKLGTEPGGPLVVLLVTYRIPSAGTLSVTSRDPRSTRISWTDHDSDRVDLVHAPSQGRWFAGVASFLLSLTGESVCARSSSH